MKHILYFSLILLGIFLEKESYAVTQKYFSTQDIASFEKYCHAEINKIRQEYGMTLLNLWSQLSDCAREHSQNMAKGHCPFGHDGFEKRAKDMQKMAKILSFGENVAYSYGYADPVKVAIDGWMESKGHRENILGEFKETGIGVAITQDGKFYVTQLFAKRR